MTKRTAICLIIAIISGGAILVNSCVHQPYVLPVNERTGDPSICFERDILPIFQSNCAKSGCHDEGSHRGGYTLDSYADLVKKGIVPGNPDASEVWESISINKGDNFMPRNAPALSSAEVYLIKRWIATGAIDSGGCSVSNCDTNNFTYSAAIAPIIQNNCAGCHNAASAPGGSLMDYTSIANAAVNGRLIGDISHLPGYNAMPNSGTALQDCQVTQIKKWVAAGALNN